MDYDTPIWHRIEELRAARGLTLQELADLSHVSRRYIYNIGHGDRDPSVAVLLSLSHALGVPVTDLLFHMYGVRSESPIENAEPAEQVDHPQPLAITTGFERVDAMTSHLRRGDLVLLHGNAGIGKTALALQWVAAVADARPGGTSSIVFNEPTRTPTDTVSRIYPMLPWPSAGGSPHKTLVITDWAHDDMLATVEGFHQVGFFVDSPKRLSRAHLLQQLRFITKRSNISLVVVDPVNPLLRAIGIGELLDWLKREAGIFDCLMVAVLNGRLEKRQAASKPKRHGWNGRLTSADLILHLGAPETDQATSDKRRLMSEDGSGIGRFTDLKLDSDHGILKE